MFIQRMLDGSYSVVPQVHLGYVTVKDTARAHIAAMTHPEANGKRFILAERSMWLTEMNEILIKNGFIKAPTRKVPNFIIKLMGIFNKEAAVIAGFVGKTKYTNSENAKNILNFNFESVEGAVVDTAKQMEDLGLIVK
jgi:dihydroflavonol-4-reductase